MKLWNFLTSFFFFFFSHIDLIEEEKWLQSKHFSLEWPFPSPMDDMKTVIIEEERKVSLNDEGKRIKMTGVMKKEKIRKIRDKQDAGKALMKGITK